MFILTITAEVEAEDRDAAEAVLISGSVPLEENGAVILSAFAAPTKGGHA